MKRRKHLLCAALLMGVVCALPVSAQAADYSFSTAAPRDYYSSTSYEDIYGSQYNYGGPNMVDYQTPELEYGVLSTIQTGLMEAALLPNLQAGVAVTDGGGYGISDGDGAIYTFPETTASLPAVQATAFTSVAGMVRSDGSIGTLTIPSLGITRKVWEGETTASMSKGLGHYASTSGWDGNVGVCGHNRGSRYAIGSIKDLKIGDTITYTTVYGTRTYAVTIVTTIANNDWSYLQATADNRITLTTCLANHPESRVCVQAVEVKS